jgi:hypothetical protein
MSNTVELYSTYSENIRMFAKQRQLEIRDLSNATGYAFEHIRKIWFHGTPKHKNIRLTVSEDCNAMLCEILGLPVRDMWEMAQREKFAEKNGFQPVELMDPQGRELTELWGKLTDEHKDMILNMGRSLALVAA